MAFSGPNIKCLLRQITGVRFGLRQTQRKLKKRAIILLDHALKVRALRTLISVTHQTAVCSRQPGRSRRPRMVAQNKASANPGNKVGSRSSSLPVSRLHELASRLGELSRDSAAGPAARRLGIEQWETHS